MSLSLEHDIGSPFRCCGRLALRAVVGGGCRGGGDDGHAVQVGGNAARPLALAEELIRLPTLGGEQQTEKKGRN